MKHLKQESNFLSVPEHAGLILCCDGVPVFKSSGMIQAMYIKIIKIISKLLGQTLWPVLMFTTSLPPTNRMNAENMMVGALWLGPCKPPMQTLIPPVLSKIEKLETTGIQFQTSEGVKTLKGKLLVGVFDQPAKAMVLNVVQFNGYYGCPYCLDKGVHKSHRHLYLPTEPHILKIQSDIDKWALQAEEVSKAVYGVKGTSHLRRHIPTKCVAQDYMHGVALGVCKSFLECSIDVNNRALRFFLGDVLTDIDKCLMRIKPPHEFSRPPRPIRNYLGYWKASEYRAWLLFYSLPILLNYLPPDYVHHFALLIASMHILLNTAISSDDIDAAENMLNTFFKYVPELYPEKMCSSNVHGLIHLAAFVRRLGPLWAYSCFSFEHMNGYIKKQRHGFKNFLPSLSRSICSKFSLRSYVNELASSEHERTLQFLKKEILNTQEGIRGKIFNTVLLNEELDAIHNAGFHTTGTDNVVTTFKSYYLRNTSYRIKDKKTLRDSSVCEFQDRGMRRIGSIRKFCMLKEGPVAIIDIFEKLSDGILKDIQASKPDLVNAAVDRFFVKVKKVSVTNIISAVATNSLIRKCVHIPNKHSPTDVIVYLPNVYEKH